MTTANIFKKLQEKGFRLTERRKAIVTILAEHKPIGVTEVIARLAKQKLQTNKTTVYREIDFLVENQIASEVRVPGVRETFYEINDSHHHHLVCDQCKCVAEVDLPEKLCDFKNKIKTKNFIILNHHLEFTGLCAHCQKN